MRLALWIIALTWASCVHAADAPAPAPVGCPAGTSFEGYTIRDARVEHPFPFLRWLGQPTQNADAAVAFLKGQRYSIALVSQGLAALDKSQFLPAPSDPPVRVDVLVAALENCDSQQLDVVYYVASTQVSRTFSASFESRQKMDESPQRASGLTRNSWRVEPRAGYDHAESFTAGGRLEARMGKSAALPFGSLLVEGWGSANGHAVTVALAGAHDSDQAWLRHAEWRLDYANSDQPADRNRLQQGQLAAQWLSSSRPMGDAAWTVRMGASLGGGNLQSNFTAEDLASHALASSGYGAARLFGGVTAQSRRHSFSASYGLELGSRSGGAVDWRKHVADVAHEAWLPIGDHRQLELESRFTAGVIQAPGSIPAGALFFGGAAEQNFVASDSWSLRANPVIRSIPANRFYRTASGAGGDSFVSYNFTGAYLAWRRPIIPPEILSDAEFRRQKDDGLSAATSVLETTYRAKDAAYKMAAAAVPEVRREVAQLQTVVKAAEAQHPGQWAAEFKRCNSALQRAADRAKSAEEAESAEDRYGNLASLLSNDETEDRLRRAHQACAVDLNSQLQDAALRAGSDALDALRAGMQADFDRIDQAAAKKKAEAEIRPARNALDTILNDVNLLSVSPVGVFDVARLGPQAGPLGGVRYGAGGGVRLTLVSSLSLTAGYAWNIHPHPGEGRGAVFFSLKFRDLLQ